jgi:predicted DCC family thiol-disulfide oxidoreductase YuxK
MSSSESMEGVTIVYDGECPFCSRYVKMVRLRQAFGHVQLVDARSNDPKAIEALQRFDLDDGMAAQIGGRWYYGADAINILSLASGSSSFANRLMARVFADPRRARALYPYLRAGRNLALQILGREKINKDVRSP